MLGLPLEALYVSATLFNHPKLQPEWAPTISQIFCIIWLLGYYSHSCPPEIPTFSLTIIHLGTQDVCTCCLICACLNPIPASIMNGLIQSHAIFHEILLYCSDRAEFIHLSIQSRIQLNVILNTYCMLSLNDTSTNEICSLTLWNLKPNCKAKQQNSNYLITIEWNGRVVCIKCASKTSTILEEPVYSFQRREHLV